jgi:hypothetical protein
MKIEISNGELLDKLSILEIKLQKIQDPEKLTNIRREYMLIKPLAETIIESTKALYVNLIEINRKLWEIEDSIRNFELNQNFSNEFIQKARSVYLLNDQRAQIKRNINLATASDLTEEKSYTDYRV